MNCYRAIIVSAAMVLFTAGAAVSVAGDNNEEKRAAGKDSLRQIEDIYNDIMLSVPQELKGRLDSARSLSKTKVVKTQALDSAGRVDNAGKGVQDRSAGPNIEIPAELRRQIENAINDMERRQGEREIQLKDIKRKR
jgi:hypothetical protein